MDYNRKELVDWVRGIYQNLDEADKQDALRFFPELHESEDEKTRKSLLAYIKKESKRLDTKKWIAYLEKQKEQKPIWSEEDERKIVELKTFIAECNGFNKSNRQKAFEMIDSLRSSWKLSEEQMEALKNSAYGVYQNGDGPALRELYEQLKKL